MSDRPSSALPWWATSLLAAGVTMVLGALALYLPPSRATVVLVLGALVFVFVLLRNPAFWRRRLAGTCLGTAAALALTPELQGVLDLGSLGVLLLDGSSVLPFVGFFLAAGVLLAWQETLAERRPGDHKTEIHIAVGGQALLAAARRHRVNLDDYLTNLLAEVDHIDIKAVHTTSKEAMRAPIEELYTPLRSRDAPHERDPGRPPDGAQREDDPRRLLRDALREHPRLLLVGKAGAGKTTFIHLIACMHARDIRQPRPPGEAPWREEHLGYPRDQPPLLPALIRLRDLVKELRDPQAAREPSDRGWLLRILAARTRPADVDDDRGRDERRQQWDRWLERGEALLLLDGLDEVSDLDLREKVKAIVRSACETWPQCRIVITSRPLLIDALRRVFPFVGRRQPHLPALAPEPRAVRHRLPPRHTDHGPGRVLPLLLPPPRLLLPPRPELVPTSGVPPAPLSVPPGRDEARVLDDRYRIAPEPELRPRDLDEVVVREARVAPAPDHLRRRDPQLHRYWLDVDVDGLGFRVVVSREPG